MADQVEKNLRERVIKNLSKKLIGKNHIAFFNNYFTSYNLLKLLDSESTYACGTVNFSRKNLSKNLIEDKKMQHGDFDCSVSSDDIVCLKWKDKRTVHMLRTLDEATKSCQVQRKERNQKTVTAYNKNIGFVDHFDQLKSMYEIDRKSKKWFHKTFFHFLDMTVVNSYILYIMKYYENNPYYNNMKNFRLDLITARVVGPSETT